jgi:hypothetical protein
LCTRDPEVHIVRPQADRLREIVDRFIDASYTIINMSAMMVSLDVIRIGRQLLGKSLDLHVSGLAKVLSVRGQRTEVDVKPG